MKPPSIKAPAIVGDTLLRVALGIMFIAHSVVLKYFTFTLAGTAQYFASIGLPASLAYVVFALEAVGGVLLVLGIGRVGSRSLSCRCCSARCGCTSATAGCSARRTAAGNIRCS